MPENQTMPPLADDVLRGAQAIADAVNLPRRKVFHKLENGHIPATKEGGVWVTTRSQLINFYNSPTNNIPPVIAEEQTTTASPKRRKKSRSRDSEKENTERPARTPSQGSRNARLGS